MSDDEYYDSPYDEFEEMLYDADPGPNLADDLAQHAAYSPVWHDDPAGELELYHSDWEYYSDDYYDDDPAILKKNPLDGTPPKVRKLSKAPPKRGKKRKLDETDIALEPAVNQCLRNTIRGTVWAENTSPRTKIFKTGQQEKVALLIDWKKRPQLEDSTTRPQVKTKLTRDESWANDLGLEDMGLRRVHEHAGTDDNIIDEGDEGDIDDDEQAFAEGRESILEEDLDGTENGDMSTSSDHQNHEPEAERARSSGAEDPVSVDNDVSQEQQYASPRKRLKLAGSQPSDRSRTEHTDTISTRSNHLSRTAQGRVKQTPNNQIVTSKNISSKQTGPQTSHKAPQRKRKLSFSTEESSTAAQSTESSRAKRVASSKLGQNINSNTSSKEPPASNTRSTRARKK